MLINYCLLKSIANLHNFTNKVCIFAKDTKKNGGKLLLYAILFVPLRKIKWHDKVTN